mgnify:FL=1
MIFLPTDELVAIRDELTRAINEIPSEEEVRDSIPHSRKTAFGQWAQGLLRDMFHYGEASHVASI